MTMAETRPFAALPQALSDLIRREPPRATGFIVTLYGDAVVPRGGELSMRTLIEVGAVHGLSESLIRTAVSRLVSAGWLRGERIGRTSFYRLTPAAEAESAAATRLLYDPPPMPAGWRVAFSEESPGPDWVRVAAGVSIAPGAGAAKVDGGFVMAAELVSGVSDMPGFAARHWSLDQVAADYTGFLDAFGAIAGGIGRAGDLPPAAALALRLRLVHVFRRAALADPRLPPEALPLDWPEPAARAVFVETYLALSEAADREIGASFRDSRGRLAAATQDTELRLDRLSRESARLSAKTSRQF